MASRLDDELTVGEAQAGMRLDQALADLVPDRSRSQLKGWIEAGGVTLDGEQRRPRDKVMPGQRIRIAVEIEDRVEAEPEAIALDVIHEDEHLVVINKPAGLVVHPGAGNPAGTLMNGLLERYPRCSELPRAGIVHRLDKATSGVMVVALSAEAHTALVAALETRVVKREYQAVCLGVLTGGGRVDAPIARHPVDRKRMAVREGGKEAVTHYRVQERFRGHTHINCRLETGRTHQIRVHMAHIRHPLVGDPVYGGRLALPKGMGEAAIQTVRGFRRQALHARHLSFEHPVTGEPRSFEAPTPADLAQLLAALREDAADRD